MGGFSFYWIRVKIFLLKGVFSEIEDGDGYMRYGMVFIIFFVIMDLMDSRGGCFREIIFVKY